jgi:negative regulator of sigma E activity
MQVLHDAIDAPHRLSYTGEVQTLHFGSQKSEAAIFRIEHRAPNLTRRWYLAPQSLYGDSVISRGEVTYSIDVKRDRVVVAEDDAIDDQVAEDDNFAVLASNYKASFAPDETFDGQRVHVVMLTNKYTGQTTMRLRIDARTDLVLEKQIYAANGALSTQERFEDIHYSNHIPTGIFEVPKGMQVVNGPSRGLPSNDLQHVVATAGFAAQGPKYLPEGFQPVEGDVVDIKGVRTLHLLYSDGIRTVSLFQNHGNADVGFDNYKATLTKVENHEAKYVEDGSTVLLAWSESGLHFTLVGELALPELEKIAASVIP